MQRRLRIARSWKDDTIWGKPKRRWKDRILTRDKFLVLHDHHFHCRDHCWTGWLIQPQGSWKMCCNKLWTGSTLSCTSIQSDRLSQDQSSKLLHQHHQTKRNHSSLIKQRGIIKELLQSLHKALSNKRSHCAFNSVHLIEPCLCPCHCLKGVVTFNVPYQRGVVAVQDRSLCLFEQWSCCVINRWMWLAYQFLLQ